MHLFLALNNWAVIRFFSLLLAVFSCAFLFWRAGRHEFIESDALLDIFLVGAIGAFIGSRLMDFVVRFDAYQWSFSRLIFFNVYRGADFYGALVGMAVLTYFYLKGKRLEFWKILDLSAAPLVFSMFIFSLGGFIRDALTGAVKIPGSVRTISGLAIPVSFYFAILYLAVFIFIKRLWLRKRHTGYFACFYLASIAVVDLVLFFARRDVFYILRMPYQLIMPAFVLLMSSAIWYLLAKRSFRSDIKAFFAFVLLSVFNIKKTLTNINEAGKFAKNIVFSPYFLLRSIFLIVGGLLRQIWFSFCDLLLALGVRK